MEIELNEPFQRAIRLLENGENVFITGKAGTGKSTLLHYFRKNTQKNIVVLAPTGVSAVNIQGETVHSFFGFKPGITPAEAEKAGKESRYNPLFKALERIVIDEISMVRADLLDCVDIFLQVARENKEAFGGLPMAFIGDLYQLPPVVAGEEKTVFQNHYSSPYFFDAAVMKKFSSHIAFVELEKIYRQSDEAFINLLNGIRNRTITDEQLSLLNKRVLSNAGTLPADCIYLTTTNAKADAINRENLAKLGGRKQDFQGAKEGEFDGSYLPTEESLSLKKGARVMFVNNDSYGRWVNGTLGTVVRIAKERVEVKLDDGGEVEVEPVTWNLFHTYYDGKTQSLAKRELGRFTQIPLRLAWAVTIHKSQGKTFDSVVIDLDRGAFSHGQVYVALSRCRSLDGLFLKTPVEKKHLLMDYRVVRFLTQWQYH
jgi:ATP-dependent DNA helicase PIF1